MFDKDTFLNFKKALEKEILATVFSNPSWFSHVASSGLCAEDFSDKDHQELFKIKSKFFEEGRKILFSDVMFEFQARTKRGLYVDDWSQEFAQKNLAQYLPLVPDEYRTEGEALFDRLTHGLLTQAEFDTYTISSVNLDQRIEHLKIMSKRLKIATLSNQLASKSYAMEYELPIYELEKEMSSFHEKLGPLTKSERIPVYNKFDAILDRMTKEPKNRFLTGFSELDSVIDSKESSSVIVVGARPGTGKTSLAIQVMFENLKRLKDDEVIFYFSLEAGDEEVLKRLFHLETGTVIREGISSNMAFEVSKKVNKFRNDYQEALNRLEIRDVGVDCDFIRNECKRYSYDHKIKLVIVDYLQLVRGDEKNPIREQVVAKISRSLKEMSLALGCHILLLSQLNRAVETRADKRPTLADLRESGAIEQDANIVLLINRDLEKQLDTSEIIVAKNRYGRTGTATLGWNKEKAAFCSLKTGGWNI